MCRPGEQVGAVGIGEKDFDPRDLLVFRKYRGERLAAAGLIGALGVLHLDVEQHAKRSPFRGAESGRRGDDDTGDGNRGGGQEPEQSLGKKRSHAVTASSGL